MPNPATLSAAQQARLVRRRKLSAVELVTATLDRIERLNPVLNAFITVTASQALREARLADRALAKGQEPRPLHGVPVALKDNYETAGVRTTAGSRVFLENVPSEDAEVVARLRRAGAIIVGKTHLSEFARGPMAFGDVRNPWGLDRTPGGSSAGSGAAIGARMIAVAMGHDTGGSTRIPAALCGGVGLKETFGRVSRRGIMPLEWSMDNPGPITRTVEDAALVLSAIAGRDIRDPGSSDRPAHDYRRGLRGGVRGLRLGLPREWFFDVVDSEVKRAVMEAVRLFEGLGADTREVSMPSVRHTEEIGDHIVFGGAISYHEGTMASSADKYGPSFLAQLRARRFMSAADYVTAQRLRRLMRAEFLEALKDIDLIITPTTPQPAPQLGQAAFSIEGRPVSSFYSLAAFTRPFSLTGLPAMTLPCGFSRAGLPVGLQLAGRPFDEATVLRAGHAYQRHTAWHTRRPRLEMS